MEELHFVLNNLSNNDKNVWSKLQRVLNAFLSDHRPKFSG